MSHDLISRRLRTMLMEHLSGSSVLREIENEFEAADIPHRPDPSQNVGGARRSLVQDYYNGLNFGDPRDARKFLNVLAVFMRNMERTASYMGSTDALDRFKDQLRRDGYAYQDGVIGPITAAARLADAKAIAHAFDASHIHEQIQRIEASIDTDPALAIGTAKELPPKKGTGNHRIVCRHHLLAPLLGQGSRVVRLLQPGDFELDNVVRGVSHETVLPVGVMNRR